VVYNLFEESREIYFREMILTLLEYNNGTTRRHIEVRLIFGSHPNVFCCCPIVINLECCPRES
jgi:hypothetical protein